jgi:hypothetical protein
MITDVANAPSNGTGPIAGDTFAIEPMRMYQCVIFMFLMLIGVGFGVDVTVPGEYATIALALDQCTGAGPHTITISAGTYNERMTFDTGNNGADITIKAATGATVTSTYASNYNVYCNGMTSGSITYEDILFRNTGAANSYCVYNNKDVNMTFTRCTFGNSSDNETYGIRMVALATPTRDLTITDCTATSKIGYFLQCNDVDVLTMTGNTIDQTNSSQNIITLLNVCNTAWIYNNTITKTFNSNAKYAIEIDAGGGIIDCDWIFICNNTINTVNGGISNSGATDTNCKFWIEGNVITINTSSNAGYGIQMGAEGVTTNSLGEVVVRGNAISFTGSDNSHGILIGANAAESEVAFNYISGGDQQIVLKGSRMIVHHNVTQGANGIYLKGSVKSKAFSNTIVSTAGYALGIGENTTDGAQVSTEQCLIYDNIITQSHPSGYIISNDNAAGGVSDPNDNYIDYNCYYNLGAKHALIQGEDDPNDLAEMQLLWTTWEPANFSLCPLNDENSIEVNPNLDANYQAKNPALNGAGTPLLMGSDGTAVLSNPIGATSFSGSGGGGSGGSGFKGLY